METAKRVLNRDLENSTEKVLEKQLTCLPGCVGGSGSEYEESLYITGTSQNHRLVEVCRDLWRTSGPSPLLQQGHQLPRKMNRDTEQHMSATEAVPGHGNEDIGFRSKQSLKL